jgi:hypothetical protein
MIANKNIKFQFKIYSLNTWNSNHAQELRTYTNKIEKASNTHYQLLAESKTTLFYQNQSQTYCLDTK